MTMTIECACAVCMALTGIPAGVDPTAVIDGLSPEVRAILAAQARVVEGGADDDDRALVEQAAGRCNAGRFPEPQVH